jgi:isocitrate dehydrogenase
MNGDAITRKDGKLTVPDRPIVPFIEGDGTGPDIWRASVRVFDAAVAKTYGGRRAIEWLEVLAGEKSFTATGNWLPEETLAAFRKYLVGIKGTAHDAGRRRHPIAQRCVATGTRSVCLPASGALFQWMETPVKRPDLVDMVIFRENCEGHLRGH